MGSNISTVSITSDSLGIVADWTHALNRNGELSDVLERLIRLVKADAAMIIRTSKADNRAKYVARSDAQKGKIWPTHPQSFAETTIGEFMSTAKAGSIWKLSDVVSSKLSGMPTGSGAASDDVVEAILSPLESTLKHTDHIEFQFRHQPAEHDVNLVIMLIGTFAAGWGRRAPASVSNNLGLKRVVSLASSEEAIHVSILGIENPAKLSRSEFRICSLLKEGMVVSVIADTLSIGVATVRSHLSSIFSKTETSGQIELLHKLNMTPATFQHQSIRQNSGVRPT